MSKKKPDISYENGRWSVGSYSTSVPNKLINHLRKKYQVEISFQDVLALAAPAATAVPEPPAPPNKPDADDKEK